jgi:N-acetylmuramoyl-L-alanine amidase
MSISLTKSWKGWRKGPDTRNGHRQHLLKGLLICALILAVVGMSTTGMAADPKESFFRAQTCYENLREHPKKQKYRSNWFPCIEKFRSVYNLDPDGQWAPAGLYMTGKLYLELHKKSFLGSDLKEAEDLFRRITLRFPKSQYSQKATAALETLSRSGSKKKMKLPTVAPADSPYGQAQAAYAKLKQSPRRQKYRENWFTVIRKFESVYKHDPHGPAAAAALYTTGELYLGLSQKSFLTSDRREARDVFKRVVSRFDGSPYAEKAQKQLAAFEKKSGSRPAPKQTPAKQASQTDSQRDFNNAEKSYRSLAKSKKRSKYRDQWKRVIGNYQKIADRDPEGPWAAAGLFRAGECYLELHRHSFLVADQERGLDLLAQVVKGYPRSRYSPKATAILIKKGREVPTAVASAPVGVKSVSPQPGTDAIAQQIFKANTESKTGRELLATKVSPGIATVTGLRYWSNPSYTRIVIDADSDTTYTHRLLKKDASLNKPQRLFVDLKKARLDRGTRRKIPINDNLLSDARAGQYNKDTVRVVVDIKSFKTYKIFPLKNPFRIVIDVRGQDQKTKIVSRPAIKIKMNGKVPAGAIARQFSLGVSRIVIDPGHGGKDYGARGYYKGVHEKNVALQISKKLANKIRKQLGCEVLMTRTTDKYLTLEERTAFANTKNADLFISIHTNAIKDKRAYGIETYFLNLATDDEAIRVAAFENATSTKNISDLQTILTDLMQNAKINESSRLAGNVQDFLTKNLKIHYKQVRSKGVKQAPFYVLLGAQMPSVLIETSFISNPRECKRLTNPRYQDRLCDGIIKGIRGYIKEINPTAYRGKAGKKG